MMVLKKEQETMKREALITDDTGISSGFAAQFFNIFSSPPRFQHFLSFLLLLASLFHRLQCFTIYTVSCLKLFCTHNMWTFTKAPVWLIVCIGREKMLENGLLQFMTSTLPPLFPTILPRSVPIFQHLVFFCVWRMFLSSDALPVDIANGQWTSSTEALSPDFLPFFFLSFFVDFSHIYRWFLP